MTQSKENIIYLAGLIEGATFSGFNITAKRQSIGNVYFKLICSRPAIPEWIKKNFGGGIVVEKYNRTNGSAGYKYIWRSDEKTGPIIINSTYPYLVDKKDYAALLMEYYSAKYIPNIEIRTDIICRISAAVIQKNQEKNKLVDIGPAFTATTKPEPEELEEPEEEGFLDALFGQTQKKKG